MLDRLNFHLGEIIGFNTCARKEVNKKHCCLITGSVYITSKRLPLSELKINILIKLLLLLTIIPLITRVFNRKLQGVNVMKESGSFRPLSLSPLVVSPSGRFAHFPIRPRVVSLPYKIFLVLFRPQNWYKALIFLLIDDFRITYKRWGKNWAFYAVFWKVTQQLRMSTAILI